MNEGKIEHFDVLGALEDVDSTVFHEVVPEQIDVTPAVEETPESPIYIMDDSHLFFEEEDPEEKETVAPVATDTPVEKKHTSFYSNVIFLCKYLSTSALIFVVLLFTTNYSAYYNVISSYVFQKDFQEKSQSLLNSVEASDIVSEEEEELSVSLESATVQKIEDTFNSIDTLAAKAKNAEVDLGITITPYENRIVIPKIGKNIPLLDIQQEKVEGLDELNDIFMKELENGVIRYPGSAKPGQAGNTFVFGHSSNFPWLEGEYNDVFSLLDKVVYDDEIIAYYDQKKYIYKIRKKEIIRPGDVSILKRDKGRSEITLMTCWPIGTTLNRMILIGDLVEVQ